MNSLEAMMAKSAARIIRAGRKKRGLNQQEVAKRLGVSQGNFSKIENGLLVPSAPQWFEFCEMVEISPLSLSAGYIESNQPAVVHHETTESGFRLPNEYGKNSGSKVRAMIPFLSFFESSLGVEKLDSFLESLKLDPDFFVDLGNQINFNFFLDISRYLVSKGIIRQENISNLINFVHMPKAHGSLFSQYETQLPENRIRCLFSNSKQYECNFNYELQDSPKGLTIMVKPEEHLNSFNYKDDPLLGNFTCLYKKSYFESFLNFGMKHSSLLLNEVECQFKGAEKCIYEYNAAS